MGDGLLSHSAAKNEPLMVGQLTIALFISISVTKTGLYCNVISLLDHFNRSPKIFHNLYYLDRIVPQSKKFLNPELRELSK